MKSSTCYICASKNVTFSENVNGYDVYQCNDCKLKWVEDGITEQIIADFYNNNYFQSHGTVIGYRDYLKEERNHRRNAQYLIKQIEKVKKLDNTHVLDIGCAYGFLLDEIGKNRKCEVTGVEVNQDAVDYAKKNLNINIVTEQFRENLFEPSSFDVVLLIGTIEHLISPREILQEIFNILKPGGLLIVTTMDTAGKFPLYSIKPPEHIFYFNHSNISQLLEEKNFSISKIKTYFVFYDMDDIFYRLGLFFNFKPFSWLFMALYKIFTIFNKITIQIPTNEMLVISKKSQQFPVPRRSAKIEG